MPWSSTDLEKISEILEKPKEDIDMIVAGINHFHWVLEIKERKSGKDLYPLIRERIMQSKNKVDPFIRQMFKLFGYFTYPHPSHPGEYVPFSYEMTGSQFIKWGLGKVSRKLSAKASDFDYTWGEKPNQQSYELWSMEQREKIRRIINREEAIFENFINQLALSREITCPIICDIEFNLNKKEIAANVVNKNLAISNLPQDAIVEVPIQINKEGITQVKVRELPEAIAGICNFQVSIQKLLIEAFKERSKKILLQALFLFIKK
ncbi:MAG: family 4 glycosyl hydrolase [Candidatus Humimicrobiaceae bacterium]